MECKKKRKLANLFAVYKCENCKYFQEDEEYYIGQTKISIFYSEFYCRMYYDDMLDKDMSVAYSEKIRIFLKDAIYNKDKNIIVLWFDEYNQNYFFNVIEVLLNFKMDIFIMTNFLKKDL